MLNGLPVWMFALTGGVLGLFAGSYLATLLMRWPAGLSSRLPVRSHCDACHRALTWYELLPVISFAILRGRCRTCKAPIAPFNSAFEAICGVIGVIFFAAGDLMLAPLVWILLTLAIFDYRHLWLPDLLVFSLAVVALLATPWQVGLNWEDRLLAGALAFSALNLLSAAFRRLRKREGLGAGDAKLIGAIGLWCGTAALPAIVLLACSIGMADAFRRIRLGAKMQSVRLPFGTYLAISATFFIAFQLQRSFCL